MVQATSPTDEALCDHRTVEEIAKARVSIEFAGSDPHDRAHDLWDALRQGDPAADLEADYYDCVLCGETMFVCMDYTHKPDCPYEVFGRAIDAFDEALQAALPALALSQDEERLRDTAHPLGKPSPDTNISSPLEGEVA